MKRIFVDANVLVDLLTERRGFYDDAKKLFKLCKERKITPYISSVSIAIINYLLLKIYNEKKAREELEKILRLENLSKLQRIRKLKKIIKTLIFPLHQYLQNKKNEVSY